MWSVSFITCAFTTSASSSKQETGQVSHEQHKQQNNRARRLETCLGLRTEMIPPNQLCASGWTKLDAAAWSVRWSALIKWLVLILLSSEWYFTNLIHCGVAFLTSCSLQHGRISDSWLCNGDETTANTTIKASCALIKHFTSWFEDVLKRTHPRHSLYIIIASYVLNWEAAIIWKKVLFVCNPEMLIGNESCVKMVYWPFFHFFFLTQAPWGIIVGTTACIRLMIREKQFNTRCFLTILDANKSYLLRN